MSHVKSQLKVIKTGPGTSIQDLGRTSVGQFGIPYSGVLDRVAFDWVNHLLKNDENAAVLEISQPGFTAEFASETTICLAGAIAEIKLNDKKCESFGLIKIQSGEKIQIGKFIQGSMITLGIKEGFQTESRFGSRSWYAGITENFHAKNGDFITYFKSEIQPKPTGSKAKWNFNIYDDSEIFAYPGPEWDELDKECQEFILNSKFTISSLKNRMAIQLEELISNSITEISTAPVFPGTVQLTSGGKAIILLQDAQVTGGYPRILQILPEKLPYLVQKRPGDHILFQLLN